MDDIIFLYYKANGTISRWATFERKDFSTENLEEEIKAKGIELEPKTYEICIVSNGWVFTKEGT